MIGDPSGRSATRPQLTHEQVLANAESYRTQAFKVLDPAAHADRLQRRLVRENDVRGSDPAQQPRDPAADAATGRFQEARSKSSSRSARTKFNTRSCRAGIRCRCRPMWNSAAPISFSTSSSGAISRKRKASRNRSSCCLPILEGLDGVKKMSKSLGNYVGVTDPPNEMFGKLMSISDELMARYYPLLLGRPQPSGLASDGGEEAARARNRRHLPLARRKSSAPRRSGIGASAKSVSTRRNCRNFLRRRTSETLFPWSLRLTRRPLA